MWTSNNALVPDPDKEDILSSNPPEWPVLAVGLRMCSWADDVVKFYLLGNPVVWWSGTASLGVFLSLLAVYVVRIQRKIRDLSQGRSAHDWLWGDRVVEEYGNSLRVWILVGMVLA
ncbi:hypothetical protein BC936DRAFT_137586 [Jimgerdemannia flammicorona]|uniref:Dolichyl-phosphate-mannose--protein mannosyltransferase n=1 Tax=Jimgerdemannia flammicorona TaxID=994334 RepID=A0A433CX03_9FUNG|nr:hypothetical protein BC936DRAFT_137586 [Jimgerdemannia flammicorona]